MDIKKHKSVIDIMRETEHSMRVIVKIPRDEEDRIVVNALIRIRNSDVNRNSDMTHFDKVIRHYLVEDEFKKYVIEEQKIKF